jgi:hypothetical protein
MILVRISPGLCPADRLGMEYYFRNKSIDDAPRFVTPWFFPGYMHSGLRSFAERFHEVLILFIDFCFAMNDPGGGRPGNSVSMVYIVPLPQRGQRSGL